MEEAAYFRGDIASVYTRDVSEQRTYVQVNRSDAIELSLCDLARVLFLLSFDHSFVDVSVCYISLLLEGFCALSVDLELLLSC